MCSALVARGEPIAGSDVKLVLFVLFNNDVCVLFNDSVQVGAWPALGVASRSCSNRGRQAAEAAKQWERLQQWEYLRMLDNRISLNGSRG